MTTKKRSPREAGYRLHLLSGWVRLNSNTLAQIALFLLMTVAVVWQAVAL